MRYIFVTGMGRSGTTTFAKLLTAITSAEVRHEYIGNREFWLLSWYLSGEVYSKPFLQREKRKIDSMFSKPVFIDVNGYLQCSTTEIEKVFRNVRIFHLVRDGRDVVRSLYLRRSENRIHLIPKNREEISKWMDADRFCQICWNWNSTTS